MMFRIAHRRGVILIFTLWVLSFLTVLAVSVAAGIRQKMILIKRLDERSRMANVTQAGAKKAFTYIRQQMTQSGNVYSPYLKANLHNNPTALSNIQLKRDVVDVVIEDEERKINLNRTTKQVLTALLTRVLSIKDDEASQLAGNLLDWRQYGDSGARGFFSDDYYANLQYPYKKKDANYELPDELLLVKGMNKERQMLLQPYLTIYGDGRVNINTASEEVLVALGLDEGLVATIVNVRRGKDEVEATGDDYVFTKIFDVAIEINSFIKLEPQHVKAIDALNAQGLLDVNSSFFLIKATGRLEHQSSTSKVTTIFGFHENRILYWNEK